VGFEKGEIKGFEKGEMKGGLEKCGKRVCVRE